ncbi:MAG: heat-inducible transcription repressor HrcA [Ignavibacteriales bacterium CG_4_9_14_3_um_filter_30_11]|nr:MAG: heat-inducible transcription repressor HrcA [Ignavibacteriales bacterium CG_4_9_14_3_um_filter_30_11]
MLNEELNDREKNILRYIIQQFVLTASPVGSRNITKQYNIGLSPATVRNIMSDLEDLGYINHPHTSAGRIPTDKGYRTYVDSLISVKKLSKSVQGFIDNSFENISQETDELLKLTSKLLSKITHQLACVVYPNFNSAILRKIQLVWISSKRILVVVSIKSGMIKTITLELKSSIKQKQIESVQGLLNERLHGLSFAEIRDTFAERFKDISSEEKPVVRLFVESANKIFTDKSSSERLVISGVKNVIQHPEFEEPERFQSIIELLDDEEIIIHILDKKSESENNTVQISIGSENEDQKLTDYSFISKTYKIGNTSGSLGIIGPKRMKYSKVIAIVDYMSKMLSEILTNRKSY